MKSFSEAPDMSERYVDSSNEKRTQYSEFEHGPISHDEVLEAVIALKESGVKDPSNMKDPEVQHVSALFENWYKQEAPFFAGEENQEAHWRFALMQDRIPFEAGWVTDPIELKKIDDELDRRLQASKEFNFPRLGIDIEKYRQEVNAKIDEEMKDRGAKN